MLGSFLIIGSCEHNYRLITEIMIVGEKDEMGNRSNKEL